MNYSTSKIITVIGGGNIGTQFACICASRGYRVNLFTSKPDKFNEVLEVVNENDETTIGKLNLVTSDMKMALDGCEVVFVTHPAFRLKEIADMMLPHVTEKLSICVVPGTGGAEFAFRDCIRAGAKLFGIQRVPTVARLEEYGKRVRCEGLRPELFIASIPNSSCKGMSELMYELWGIPCNVLPNYLSVTLTPSNPILHTTRLRTLFSNYEAGMFYDRNPLFYGEWSDDSSDLLLKCDAELQMILKRMDKIDLSSVKSLKIHYCSETTKELTNKLCSIKSLHNLYSPMLKVDEGWIPDFNSRYFTADFPYGLAIIEEFAAILNVDVPNIRETMDWYRNLTGNKKCLDLNEYGLNTVDDIYELYSGE